MLKRLVKKASRLKNNAVAPWRDSYFRLKITCPVKMPANETPTISVAIPHYNGAKLAHVALFNILNDPRIAEIVVLDDGSRREEFNALKEKMRPFAQKVKLFRRDVNWGAFPNKIQAVDLCTSDWLVLLDCDNTLLPEYLDAIFSIKEWETSTIYCSGYAYPRFDFRESLGGKTIDIDLARSMANSGDFNAPFFNDGNYFVHGDSFVDCMKPFRDYSVSASDVVFANYLWLSSNNTLKALRKSRYLHRIHAGNTWSNNSEASLRVLKPIMKRFRDKLSPHSECMNVDFDKSPNEWIEPARISLNK